MCTSTGCVLSAWGHPGPYLSSGVESNITHSRPCIRLRSQQAFYKLVMTHGRSERTSQKKSETSLSCGDNLHQILFRYVAVKGGNRGFKSGSDLPALALCRQIDVMNTKPIQSTTDITSFMMITSDICSRMLRKWDSRPIREKGRKSEEKNLKQQAMWTAVPCDQWH